MKFLAFALVAALAAATTATGHAQSAQPLDSAERPQFTGAPAGGTAASLSALLAEWNRAAFNPPSKPGQFRVYGRDGYVTSGQGYNEMVSLIRSAVREAGQGRDHAAAVHIAEARGLLTGVATAAPVRAKG